jgi:hypothetical protein
MDSQDVLISIPIEVWNDICESAEKHGRTRTAEMLSRFQHGRKPVVIDQTKVSVPVEPRRSVGKARMDERAEHEIRDVLRSMAPCGHYSLRFTPGGSFCKDCGIKVG